MCNKFSKEFNVVKTDSFSSVYPIINNEINKQTFKDSRGGRVKEFLDFKTIINNPYKRCVGGCERNINVFFLLAEAMWIALGRKDVKFLNIFNKKMKDFSDDGINFHAPYGFRLRHWGVRTEDSFIEEGLNASRGYDQVVDAIRILSENPESRQVVMSIWNPNFDLGYKTKDIPCNDIIFLKIRNGKLVTTIQNRSNDLHWGLPTNIFQFSFLTELMSNCIGIKLGSQTHNSQSLHVYNWNKITDKIDNIFNKNCESDILDMYGDNCNAKPKEIDFNFSHEVSVNRFREIEYHLNSIIENLIKIDNKESINIDSIKELKSFSNYFYNVYNLLKLYIEYKQDLLKCENKEKLRLDYLNKINDEFSDIDSKWDILILSKNFFGSRLLNYEHKFIGKL